MIQKIVHIVLAMMVLLSSSGFIVQRHFCQNELKSVSIYLKPDHCHTESVATKSCPMHGTMPKAKKQAKGCCDDLSDFLKLDTKVVVSSEADLVDNFIALDLFESSCLEALPKEDFQKPHYLNYKPPLLISDLSVSLQIFLC